MEESAGLLGLGNEEQKQLLRTLHMAAVPPSQSGFYLILSHKGTSTRASALISLSIQLYNDSHATECGPQSTGDDCGRSKNQRNSKLYCGLINKNKTSTIWGSSTLLQTAEEFMSLFSLPCVPTFNENLMCMFHSPELCVDTVSTINSSVFLS